MPYCVNCAFFIPPDPVKHAITSLKLGLCRRKTKYHPVDGEPTYYGAWDERMAGGTCSPEGRHFVQIVPSTHVSHSDIASEIQQQQINEEKARG
jgi:hypothetical protein